MFIPMYLLWSAYGMADILMTVTSVITAEKKSIYLLLLPLIFPLLHITYGVGTIIGFIKLPLWKKSLDGSAEREIEEVKRCVINNKQEENQ